MNEQAFPISSNFNLHKSHVRGAGATSAFCTERPFHLPTTIPTSPTGNCVPVVGDGQCSNKPDVASLAAKALQEKPGNQIAGLASIKLEGEQMALRLRHSEFTLMLRVGGVLIPQQGPVNHKNASVYLEGCCHNNMKKTHCLCTRVGCMQTTVLPINEDQTALS